MVVNLDSGPRVAGARLWHKASRPAGYLLAPLLIGQGRLARAKRGRLPNAPMPWSGVIEGPSPIQVLGLGDSTIAGVGVDDPMLGLTSQFSKNLYAHTQRGVIWNSVGQRGITSSQLVADYLPGALADHDRVDVAFVSIGANDAKNLASAGAAIRHIVRTIDTLHTSYPDALVIVSSLPAFHLFESLPQPLRAIMAGHTQAIERQLRPLVEARRFALMTPPPTEYPAGFFATDGFHPSAEGYRIWAGFALDYVAGRGGFAHLTSR
ncbi:SGNH/GDSL hydrolase family protein [Pontimonas sp.]|uniref:SGNH/GDSL hydrolase family protein n=1 Tax=Pontimonas sp. TaxID=2304492 RepID=UPI002870909D|nr:SGNH/GDSL hydrolase family protein [Pontimonas sp.]MDR9396384.1 SGNH/GDSL hydrolase family protein [Pontimonas sp.]